MAHVYASCLHFRILTINNVYCINDPIFCYFSVFQNHKMKNMYFLNGPLLFQLSISQTPKGKCYVFHNWYTSLLKLYHIMYISSIVGFSAKCLQIRLIRVNYMYWSNCPLLLQLSVTYKYKRKQYVFTKWSIYKIGFYI